MGDRYSDALYELAYEQIKIEVDIILKDRLRDEYPHINPGQWKILVDKVSPRFRFKDVDPVEVVTAATRIMFNEEMK